MTAADVLDLYNHLERSDVRIWIDGGWCVDALLGRQTRPHNDVDIAIQWKDVPKLRALLKAQGYRQVREDGPWNFVLGNDKGREIDVHGFVYDEIGNVVEGTMYPAQSLTGVGDIEGTKVRCIAPKFMVVFLAPWIHKHPDKYLPAVSALCEKFGISLPQEYIQAKQARHSPNP